MLITLAPGSTRAPAHCTRLITSRRPAMCNVTLQYYKIQHIQTRLLRLQCLQRALRAMPRLLLSPEQEGAGVFLMAACVCFIGVSPSVRETGRACRVHTRSINRAQDCGDHSRPGAGLRDSMILLLFSSSCAALQSASARADPSRAWAHGGVGSSLTRTGTTVKVGGKSQRGGEYWRGTFCHFLGSVALTHPAALGIRRGWRYLGGPTPDSDESKVGKFKLEW